MKYSVIYERAPEGGFWAHVPDLPGATSFGETLADAEANIREAVELWIEGTRAHGEPVPEPTTVTGAIEVAA